MVWDDYRGGTVLAEQTVSLDSDGCAHRYLPHLENAAAGFRWEWYLRSAPQNKLAVTDRFLVGQFVTVPCWAVRWYPTG
jgi:hypothetical protein